MNEQSVFDLLNLQKGIIDALGKRVELLHLAVGQAVSTIDAARTVISEMVSKINALEARLDKRDGEDAQLLAKLKELRDAR